MNHATPPHCKVLALLTLVTLVGFPFLCWTTTFAQAKKPINKDGLVEAIRLKGYTAKELIKQIETRGVSFEMNTEVEAQLVTAGARSEIIQAARANYRPPVGTLNVTASVPGAKITVSGHGSSKDRVTGLKLPAASYEITGELLGHRTDSKLIEIKAGETSDVKLDLVRLSPEEAHSEEPAKPAQPEPSRDASATEIAFWDSIKTSTNPEDIKLYIKKYPSGAFIELANARLERFEQNSKEAEEREASRRKAAEFARISIAGSTWQGTSVGRDKRYAFEFDSSGTFRMGLVYWGIQSATTGVWTQDGTQIRITLANPKEGEMVATINGQQMQGEWHVPEKKGVHTYRFVMQRVR